MAARSGVFMRSTRSNEDIIKTCNNLIKNSIAGGKITAVRKDETYEGVKVYFNRDDLVEEFIGKKPLFENGDDLFYIYPLTTCLTVHNAIVSSTEEEEFKEDLQNVLEDSLGPVLEISKIPVSKLHPNIGNGNWRVLLDIPEIEDLDVYKKRRLPDNFTIKVPGVHGKLPVTFYCTKCDKDGHTQLRCIESFGDETKALSNKVKREDSTIETPSKSPSRFFIRDHEEESREREEALKNKSLLKIKNIREFESEIGKEEVRNYCDSVFLKSNKGIKEEKIESDSFRNNSEIKRRYISEEDDCVPIAKKSRNLSMIDDDNHAGNLPKASSTTNDADSLEILYESSPPSAFKNEPYQFPLPSVGGSLTRNSVDDSVSTSNQPAPIVDNIKSELPSTDECDSDSNQNPPRTKPIQKRKKPAQSIPIVIPDRIQRIISEIEGGVLDVEQLTAFFNHVKKKSKPCSFAEMYTSDVAGLKRQLDEIRKRYYMIPDRGTNQEIQFMKWFVNILDRFDGTPSTRKKKATA